MTREEAISKLHGLIYGVVDRQRIDDTCREVIEYLEAQEPRVMTLDEVLALKEGTPVYVEDSGGLHSWDVFAGIAPDSSYDVMTGAPWTTMEYWPKSEYNDTWRCWTSRPSDEVREATPWE